MKLTQISLARCRVWLGLLLLFCTFVPAHAGADASVVSAADEQALIAQARSLGLHAHPRWRLLLHMPRHGGPSQVLSDEFFLAPTGREDAAAELVATLRALLAPFAGESEHARCRFPARQLWLASELNLPQWLEPDRRCGKIWQWLDLDQLKSASVVLVSGYFGNPASAFGHALLRFDAGSGERTGGLSDLSVNFGALVPQDENMLVYVARGLSGGYVAGFSDKDFAEHDQVYVRGENRDMWNYELALDPWALRMLVLHVWEIAGKKFTYFFLSRNCAWRLAELLELVLPTELRQGADESWYVPVELFHRLEQAHAAGPAQYRVLRFQPSAQRQLVEQLRQLTLAERSAFEQAVAQDAQRLELTLSGLAPREVLRVLELLMSWANWKNPAGLQDAEHAAVTAAKQRILLARLALPVGTAELAPAQPLPSPALGTAPMRFAFGGVRGRQRGRALGLRWTGIAFDLNGLHGLDTGELQVADIHLRLQGNRLRLQEIGGFSVRKLNQWGAQLPGELDYAWQIKLGARQPESDGLLRPYARAGLGQATHYFGSRLQAFAFLDLEVMSRPAISGWSPNAGLLWAEGDWRARLEWRRVPSLPQGSRQTVETLVQRRLSSASVLALGLSRDPAARVTLQWQHFR
ncbi:DUF4105 domain-containing protein [Roseateles sp.]|uniref:Lnb N-terminal periplasmic domain-containing protein n=1 Tax=Roseateles sp. TaxID=1971397 RepID=UPI003D0FFD51